MKHIVIDLEMNPVSKDATCDTFICHTEVIQIGAVILDEKYHEIGSFMTLVKPEYNDIITPKIVKLTGIRTEMVESAPVFEEAIKMFFDWCDTVSGDFCIYEWSDSDRDQIDRELKLKDIKLCEKHQKMMDSWQDFQNEFGTELGLENKVSLKNALRYAGVDFEGRQHDALYDARNTAVLLSTVRVPELRKKALDKVIEILRPSTLGSALGDMFDFSSLALGA